MFFDSIPEDEPITPFLSAFLYQLTDPGSDFRQRDHMLNKSVFTSDLRHSIYDTGFLVLTESQSPARRMEPISRAPSFPIPVMMTPSEAAP